MYNKLVVLISTPSHDELAVFASNSKLIDHLTLFNLGDAIPLSNLGGGNPPELNNSRFFVRFPKNSAWYCWHD